MSTMPKRRWSLCSLSLSLLCLGLNSPVAKAATSNGPSGSTFTSAYQWPGYQLTTFVDVNADRHMDVILIDKTGTKLFASIAPQQARFPPIGQPSKSQSPNLPDPVELLAPGLPEPIRSVAAADFNGDSVADLLLLTAADPLGPFKAYIAYGLSGSQQNSFDIGTKQVIGTFIAQPLVCDLNGDAVADIFGQMSDTERLIIYGGPTLASRSMAYSGPRWSPLSYSAFGDVNGDTIPDIIILVEKNGASQLQIIERDLSPSPGIPDMSSAKLIDLPRELNGASSLSLGLFVLADFDLDGQMDLLLPACTAADCRQASLFLYNFLGNSWTPVDVNWTPPGTTTGLTWSLAQPGQGGGVLTTSSLVGPTVGDVDLDGHVDLGVGLTSWSATKLINHVPGVLLNGGKDPKTGRLMMQAYIMPGATLPTNTDKVGQIAMFDSMGKGTLDFFVSSISSTNQSTVSLFLQQRINDFYFVQMTILNGLCADASSCTDGRFPYGLPVPGLIASYKTEASRGGTVSSTGLLTTQSCCGALQMPSVTFGLGPFANYVDHLNVAIPPTSTRRRGYTIPVVVPNSEVFVNPYPHDDPSRWTAKLFIQPLYNMKVLYIAITLICICVLLIIIISILQYLEIREDRQEKQREAQRFHFDAM